MFVLLVPLVFYLGDLVSLRIHSLVFAKGSGFRLMLQSLELQSPPTILCVKKPPGETNPQGKLESSEQSRTCPVFFQTACRHGLDERCWLLVLIAPDRFLQKSDRRRGRVTREHLRQNLFIEETRQIHMWELCIRNGLAEEVGQRRPAI